MSSSNGRTNITYSVTVALQGDISSLSANQTAQVVFGSMTPPDREGGHRPEKKEAGESPKEGGEGQ